jgi:hypothetical protein
MSATMNFQASKALQQKIDAYRAASAAYREADASRLADIAAGHEPDSARVVKACIARDQARAAMHDVLDAEVER